jgi:hypothetical protein
LYEPSKIKNGVFAPQEKPRLRSLSKIETPRAVQIPFPQQKLFKKYFHPSYEIINSIYSILWLILIIEILYEIKRTDQNEFKIKLIYSFLLNFISFYFITIIFSFGIFSPRMIFISKFYSETIQIPEFSMYSLILKGINWCLLFIILIFIVKILKEKAFGK